MPSQLYIGRYRRARTYLDALVGDVCVACELWLDALNLYALSCKFRQALATDWVRRQQLLRQQVGPVLQLFNNAFRVHGCEFALLSGVGLQPR